MPSWLCAPFSGFQFLSIKKFNYSPLYYKHSTKLVPTISPFQQLWPTCEEQQIKFLFSLFCCLRRREEFFCSFVLRVWLRIMAIQGQLYTDNLGFSLGNSQDLMESGCGFNQFCFSTQQQQQSLQQNLLQQQNFPQKINQNLMNINMPKQYNNITESMPFYQFLDNQRIEIDQFISLHNERLRLILNEQRKQQVALIWRKYEAKVQFLLKQKDEEIAKAANRTKELEEFLKKMEIENQARQRIANENESIVISLNNTIEQLRESAYYCSSTNAEDAESCCDIHDDEIGERQQRGKMICKSCSCRYSCMIFLPCRHLSTCKSCDSLLHQCPVCGMLKKASIEALI